MQTLKLDCQYGCNAKSEQCPLLIICVVFFPCLLCTAVGLCLGRGSMNQVQHSLQTTISKGKGKHWYGNLDNLNKFRLLKQMRESWKHLIMPATRVIKGEVSPSIYAD